MRAETTIRGKTYLSPPFVVVVPSLLSPTDAEHTFLRFWEFSEKWAQNIKKRNQKRRA
jgi:hypothetical protein